MAAIEYWGKVYFRFQAIRDKVTILIFYSWCTIILHNWRPAKISIYSLPSLVTIKQSPGQNLVLNRALESVRKKCSCNILGLVGTWFRNVSFPFNILNARKIEGKECLWSIPNWKIHKVFYYTLCIFFHLYPSCSFSGHPHLFHTFYTCTYIKTYPNAILLQWNETHLD